jgi:hypothetical protein
VLVVFHGFAAAPEHNPHITEDGKLIAPGKGFTEEITQDNRRYETQEQNHKDQARKPHAPDVGNPLHDLSKFFQGLKPPLSENEGAGADPVICSR